MHRWVKTTSRTRYYSGHEIGHTWLDHINHGLFAEAEDKGNARIQEDEANAFAPALLAPPCVLHTMGVYSLDELCRITLLDKRRAEKVFAQIHTQAREHMTDVERELIAMMKQETRQGNIIPAPILRVRNRVVNWC